MTIKKEIRQLIRERKKHRSKEYEEAAVRKCYEQVVSLPEWKEAKMVLIYIDYNHEMGTELLIREAFRTGKKVASPRVEGSVMNFYCYTKKEDLTCSKRGIWEPIPNEDVILEDALMIMPLVAFDAEKNRIGYGGGYYDKYLKEHKNHKKIAIAFEDQLVSHIEPEEHDRKPDYIITDMRIIK